MNAPTEAPKLSLAWPQPPAAPPLRQDEVHVWAASLQAEPTRLEQWSRLLSADELRRVSEFKFDLHRHRYIAGRGLLRTLLGRYLKTDPAALAFAYSPLGKPALAPTGSAAPIHFNLAHSGDLALLGFSRSQALGVDVERIRPVKDMDALVARFFCPREIKLFEGVPAQVKPAAFFNLWTRKEALLKATGLGITASLKLHEVAFLPGEPARLLSVAGDPEKAAQWILRELAPAPEFVGAMAVQAHALTLKCFGLVETGLPDTGH